MIDLNCDVGEGINNEHLIMPLITSCNVSCGAHAGSQDIIDKVISLAIKNNVKIGAHPSFPDKENFGRKAMGLSHSELQNSLEKQLIFLKERAEKQNTIIHHIKPHGALYNLIAVNSEMANIVVKAIQSVFEKANIYVPYNSVIEKIAHNHGMNTIYEVFADRNYNDDLTLVPRSLPHAIIQDKELVLKHVKRMAYQSEVKTIHGSLKFIKAQTFCIHGDHKNTVEILEFLNRHLKEHH